MAFDTFMVYVGVYADVDAAEADYDLVKDLHPEAGLIDAYDAAVIQRREDDKVKIVRKHETPTRVGGVLGGGVGLATGLVVALFPFAAIGGGLLAATTAGGAVGCRGRARGGGDEPDDLKELGEHLDAGQAGLVVVGVSDMGAKIEREMRRAEKVQKKQLKADVETSSATPSPPAPPPTASCSVQLFVRRLDRRLSPEDDDPRERAPKSTEPADSRRFHGRRPAGNPARHRSNSTL